MSRERVAIAAGRWLTTGPMMKLALTVTLLMIIASGCGGGSESDRLGVGAQCDNTDDCLQEATPQTCLNFKGGYCGVANCMHDTDCPEDSACIAHEDGINYCFRICIEKAECNANRDVDNEANCSSSVTFTDGTMGRKACVPPSS